MMVANSDRDDLPTEAPAVQRQAEDEAIGLHDCLRQLLALQGTCDQLQQALTNERDISLAVGITMAQQRLTRAEAFSLLRGNARRQRRKLADVAAELIADLQARAISKS